jgi:hypothetical protein
MSDLTPAEKAYKAAGRAILAYVSRCLPKEISVDGTNWEDYSGSTTPRTPNELVLARCILAGDIAQGKFTGDSEAQEKAEAYGVLLDLKRRLITLPWFLSAVKELAPYLLKWEKVSADRSARALG